MDSELITLYMKQLNDTQKEIKESHQLQVTTLQACVLQLKAMEIKLDNWEKRMDEEKKGSVSWKQIAQWGLIVIAVLLGISDKIPGLMGA